MTTPAQFSDVAANPFEAKRGVDGDIKAQKAVVTLAAVTAEDDQIGMIRFQEGFSLTHLAIVSDDLDTATTVTLDVGFVYDSASFTDDENAFFDGLDIAQDAGSRVWPTDDGLLTGVSFVSEGSGYLVVAVKDGPTTTEGDVTLIAQFTYDL